MIKHLAAVLLPLLAAACGGDSRSTGEAEGVVDTAFGTDGAFVLARGVLQRGTVNDILELGDGSLLIGGKNAYVAKVTASGQLDATFASGGIDDTRRGSDSIQDVARLALLPDNRIAVVEVHRTPCPHPVYCGTDYPTVVARRIDVNGGPDLGYGMNGLGRLQYSAGSIVVSPAGRVTSFAIRQFPVGSRFVVGSLDVTGAADAPFETRAQSAVEYCGARGTEFMTLQSVSAVASRDGIVVATRWHPVTDLCLVRLGPDGSLDTGFADGGRLVVHDDPATTNLWGFQLVESEERVLVVLGNGLSGPAAQALFVSANGSVQWPAEVPALAPFVTAAVLQKNQKIVTGGFPALATVSAADQNNPRLWRASSNATMYDTGFGADGAGYLPLKSGPVMVWPQKVLAARDGALVVGGHAIGTGDGALMRIR